jgi:hypothetical protein
MVGIMMQLLPEVVVGIDAGHTSQQDCEQFALDVASQLLQVAIVSIHVVREPGPHYAVAISAGCRPSADVLATVVGDLAVIDRDEYLVGDHAGARAAALALWLRAKGRVIQFPGQQHLRGVMSLADVTTLSAISHVICVGGEAPTQTKLVTHDHVRPSFQAGHLTLLVAPLDDDCLVPLEQPLVHPVQPVGVPTRMR